MGTIYDLQKRAKELRDKRLIDSITPDEVGGLHCDTLSYIAELERGMKTLGIRVVYATKAQMLADKEPRDVAGNILRFGQLAVIYDKTNTAYAENGNVYAWQCEHGWLEMGNINYIGNIEQRIDELAPKEITWSNSANLAQWTFRFPGIYDIKGERTNKNDGFPIDNAASGHTINARLIVLDSSLPQASDTPQEDDACITQILMLSNRMGGEGNIYIRSARGHIDRSKWPADGSNFTPWIKLQGNMEVGATYSLDSYTDNGMVSGIYVKKENVETFVMVVINNYPAVATVENTVPRSVSQFKYAVDLAGNVTYKSRSKIGDNAWSTWVALATEVDIKDVKNELIKRMQGKSENSTKEDTFRVLGSYRTIEEIQTAISSIDTFAAKGEVSGKWRAYIDSNVFEIDMKLLVWNAVPSQAKWIQTIKSNYKANNEDKLILSTRVHELSRTWNWDTYLNTWSPWESVNKDLYEAKKELETKIQQSAEEKYFCNEVLWLGTSIPKEGRYPERVAEELGFTLYNNAISSSGIVKLEGHLHNGRDALDLSETKAEKILRYADYDETSGGYSNDEITWLINTKGTSYEDIVLPYINGTKANCKMIVLDHGYNDGRYITKQVQAGYASIDWESTDRSTYTGAFRYLLEKIYAVNPEIIVVIAGYFSDNHHENSANYNTKDVCTMQQWVAEKYNLPLIPVWDLLHISDDIVIGSEGKSLPGKNGDEVFPNGFSSHRQFCTDTVHPSVGGPGTWNYNERSIELYTHAMLKGMRDLPGYAANAINDDALSDTSTNGVQNKVVKAAIDNAISVVSKQLGTFSVISELLGVLDGMCPQGGENSYEKYIAYVGKEQVTVENNRRVDGATTVWHQTLRCHRRLSSVRNSKNIVYGDGGTGILIDYAQSFDFPSYSPTTSLYHDNTVYGEYCRKKIYYSTSATKENGVWNRWEDMSNPYRSMQSYAKRIAIFGGSFVQNMGGVWEDVDTSKYAFTHAGRRYFLVDYLAERLNAKYFDDYAVGGNGNSITTDSAGTPVFAYNTYFQVERSFNTDRTTPANLLDDNSNVYDIYVIMLGINDYARSIEVGKATDDKNLSGTSATFCSSLKKSIDYIRANAPNAKILMITPFKAYKYAGNTVDFGWNPDTYTTNDKGYKFLDYVRAFKEVAYVTSCPCYDLLSMQNFSAVNVDMYYTDGTHPNGLGYYKVADMLAEFIATGVGHGFDKINNSGSGGGSSVTVDSVLSTTSTNAVQNKVIAQAIEAAVERGRLLALRNLYIEAGAEYNDTGDTIKKTAFWGEEVDHKPGCYYLNGLGDITEEQMAYIYRMKDSMTIFLASNDTARGRFWQDVGDSRLRTLFGANNYGRWLTDKTIGGSNPFASMKIEVIKWTNTSYLAPNNGTDFAMKTSSSMLFNNTALKVIDRFMPSSDCTFGVATNLVELRLWATNFNIDLSKNQKISKTSIIYTIGNVLKTTSKTLLITLHPNVYAKCAEGGEWYEEVTNALNIANGYTNENGDPIAGTITGGGSINIVSA